MANKHLRRKPIHLAGDKLEPDAWAYEETGGIWVGIQAKEGVVEVTVPWRTIRAALKRKDRP